MRGGAERCFAAMEMPGETTSRCRGGKGRPSATVQVDAHLVDLGESQIASYLTRDRPTYVCTYAHTMYVQSPESMSKRTRTLGEDQPAPRGHHGALAVLACWRCLPMSRSSSSSCRTRIADAVTPYSVHSMYTSTVARWDAAARLVCFCRPPRIQPASRISAPHPRPGVVQSHPAAIESLW
jgi:hypothetical protein